MVFLSGLPHFGESSKPQHLGPLSPADAPARGQRGTHVAEQMGFSRESSQSAVQVSQEAGLTKGSGFSGVCVGAVLWGL